MSEHETGTPAPEAPVRKRPWLVRLLPLVILIAAIAGVYASGLHTYISIEQLQNNREALTQWVGERPVLSAVLFILAYTVVVALSLPVGAVMSILGGFLFGTVFGALWIIIGATIGATIMFSIARTSLAEPLKARVGGFVRRMEAGFRENEFSYMLTLRLVPFFPFWAVNIAPAFLGVSLRTFVIATFVGIIPGSAVYASVGAGLGAIFDRGETPDLGIIFTLPVLGPLLGLAALSLIPVIYKRFNRKAP